MIAYLARRHLLAIIQLWMGRVLLATAAVLIAAGLMLVVHAMRSTVGR